MTHDFISKTGLSGSSKELQLNSLCACGGGHASAGKTKDRKLLRGEREVGRDCYKQKSHWRKLGAQSTVAFHWLTHDSLLLAELLQSDENIFLLTVLVKYCHFLLKQKGTPLPLPLWICIDLKCHMHERSPSGLLTILVKFFSLLAFTNSVQSLSHV